MQSLFVFAIALSSTLASAQTMGDQKHALAVSRQTYNGAFTQDVDGSARAAIADKKLVVEFESNVAKSLLYDIFNAKDEVQWIPREGGSSWSNYYVRTGSSIQCIHYSYDLLADPFPRLRCRLSIDSKGAVSAFSDRVSGKAQWHDSKYVDLAAGDLKGVTGPAATYNFTKLNSSSQVNVQVFGKPALKIYNKMTDVTETDDSMGPIPTKMKKGSQVWCAKMGSPDGFSKDPAKSVKCRIIFNSQGTAIPDSF